MGSVFAEEMLERRTRRSAALDRRGGREGNQLDLEAHALLRETDLNFAGNTEARELLRFAADVVVTTASPATSP